MMERASRSSRSIARSAASPGLDIVLEGGDFGHQRLGLGLVLLGLGLADQLGGGVALFLGFVERTIMSRRLSSMARRSAERTVTPLRRAIAASKASALALNPFDIEHGLVGIEGPASSCSG